MAFLRSPACRADDVLRRHIAGQVAELAERYAPDASWFVATMAEVCQYNISNAAQGCGVDAVSCTAVVCHS